MNIRPFEGEVWEGGGETRVILAPRIGPFWLNIRSGRVTYRRAHEPRGFHTCTLRQWDQWASRAKLIHSPVRATA